MQTREHLLSRLELQLGWNLNRLAEVELVILDTGSAMMRTLALASVCSGFKHLCLVGEEKQALYEIADGVMAQIGFESDIYIQVMSPGTSRVRYSSGASAVFIIDAGNMSNDAYDPAKAAGACYFALVRGKNGFEHIAMGTNREMVRAERRKISMTNRAEVSAACAQLIIGAIKIAGGCDAIEPLAPVTRMPLPELPSEIESLGRIRRDIIYIGGGGAIGNQHLYAESLDPVLKHVNQSSRIAIVDPKQVHMSCLSRQWLYPVEALYGAKAEWAARWARDAFPGMEVTSIVAKTSRHNFGSGFSEAYSSVDSWQARKVIAELCGDKVPWYSTGSSFFGGFARRIDYSIPRCSSPFEGVERLGERPDDGQPDGSTSCSGDQVPLPSSVLPQMILGSYTACLRRSIVLGTHRGAAAARGIEVHLTHDSRASGYAGLRWSPGRRLNLRAETEVRCAT